MINNIIKATFNNTKKNITLLVIQPLFTDTLKLLTLIKQSGFEIHTIIGLNYSSDKKLINKFKKLTSNLFTCRPDEINSFICRSLIDIINICKKNKDYKFIIIENGGYATPIFCNQFKKESKYCIGSIEETKNGLWNIESIPNLTIPVVQIANSRIKKIESDFIGFPFTSALSMCLNSIGKSIQSRNIGILGVGWIGSSVLKYLKNSGAVVQVYDIDNTKMVHNYYLGNSPKNRQNLLQSCEIIIGATGKNSINSSDFPELSDNCFLVSASSKQVEFDINYLNSKAFIKSKINEYITSYKSISNNKTINVINDGYPINFIVKSLPDEIINLILSEIILSLNYIILNKLDSKIFSIPKNLEDLVSNECLKLNKIYT